MDLRTPTIQKWKKHRKLRIWRDLHNRQDTETENWILKSRKDFKHTPTKDIDHGVKDNCYTHFERLY